MILATGIDQLFFEFIEKPEAWGFLGFLFILAVMFAYLILRFAGNVVAHEQSQIGGLLQLSTKAVVDVKDELKDMTKEFSDSLDKTTRAFMEAIAINRTAIENNTRAFLNYAEKADLMDTKIDDALTKIQEGLAELSGGLKNLTEDHHRSKEETKQILEDGIKILRQLCRELNHGTSINTDTDTAGQGSGSNGH